MIDVDGDPRRGSKDNPPCVDSVSSATTFTSRILIKTITVCRPRAAQVKRSPAPQLGRRTFLQEDGKHRKVLLLTARSSQETPSLFPWTELFLFSLFMKSTLALELSSIRRSTNESCARCGQKSTKLYVYLPRRNWDQDWEGRGASLFGDYRLNLRVSNY